MDTDLGGDPRTVRAVKSLDSVDIRDDQDNLSSGLSLLIRRFNKKLNEHGFVSI